MPQCFRCSASCAFSHACVFLCRIYFTPCRQCKQSSAQMSWLLPVSQIALIPLNRALFLVVSETSVDTIKCSDSIPKCILYTEIWNFIFFCNVFFMGKFMNYGLLFGYLVSFGSVDVPFLQRHLNLTWKKKMQKMLCFVRITLQSNGLLCWNIANEHKIKCMNCFFNVVFCF